MRAHERVSWARCVVGWARPTARATRAPPSILPDTTLSRDRWAEPTLREQLHLLHVLDARLDLPIAQPRHDPVARLHVRRIADDLAALLQQRDAVPALED